MGKTVHIGAPKVDVRRVCVCGLRDSVFVSKGGRERESMVKREYV